MNTEIINNLPEAEYHARPELSKTKLSDFIKSPYNYWFWHIKGNSPERPETKSMRIGSMVHKLWLEGEDAFQEDYLASGSMTPAPKKPTAMQLKAKNPSESTIKQIKEWEDFQSQNAGKIIANPEEESIARNCLESLRMNKNAEALRQEIVAVEQSIFFDFHGRRARSRLDGVTERGVIDLKTTQDPSPRAFMASIRKYTYGLQDYMYRYAYKAAYNKVPEYFIFVCVETSPPYHVGIYQLPKAYLAKQRDLAMRSLEELNNCEATGIWPGLNNDEIIELDMPEWS